MKNKIVDYKVTSARPFDCEDDGLTTKVAKSITKGWQPLGQAMPIVVGGSLYLFQTMVKYEKDED